MLLSRYEHPVVEPQVSRRKVKTPKIKAKDFEIGGYFGALSIQDFGTNPVYGIRAAYHVSEDIFLEAFISPKRFRIGTVVQQMFEVWVKALLIVGVLCFLIGVVIAYQGVQQLRQFGAETFTVEAVGIGMFRELGVLLTAIIVAGRSGSAFTA